MQGLFGEGEHTVYQSTMGTGGIEQPWPLGRITNLFANFAKYPDVFMCEGTTVTLTHPPIKYGQFLYLLEDVKED